MNRTVVKEFILAAFNDYPRLQNLLFCGVLLTYITCVMGNVTIIVLVRLVSSLHTSMYFFISILSILEIMFVSVTLPKLLINLIGVNNIISFNECIVQMYVFVSLGATECFLLVVMVFDRYLAITKPLQYPTIMTKKFCIKLALFPWLFGFTSIAAICIQTASLEFCGPNVIDHFFCDFSPLQNLACSDPSISNFCTSTIGVINVMVPFIVITGFYISIIKTVLKIKAERGKQKAFFTCSSHLIVTSLFYGTAIIVYVKPKGSHYDKYLAFTYTTITPMINPFIYTFRNRDVKEAFSSLISHHLKFYLFVT